MEQHSVPQHISSYEFRLVGDMTLKQFGLLASGCLVALIFYASPLPGYFKWPGIIFFVLLGVALAFFPIEERPLDRWIAAFFKAVYSPTQFVWKKEARVFEVAPEKRVLPKQPTKKGPLEEKEADFLKKANNLFQLTKIPAKPVSPPRPSPPPPPAKPEKTKPVVEAKISPELPFPQPPQIANILVGMVLDAKGKIVEEAILEIRDSQGIPVRALKTNKLGQFRIATPLKDGIYEIETEKEGLIFDIIKIKLEGKIVEPIEIRAKE